MTYRLPAPRPMTPAELAARGEILKGIARDIGGEKVEAALAEPELLQLINLAAVVKTGGRKE